MKRVAHLFMLLFLLPILLFARENPFLPPDKNQKHHQTTNIEPARRVLSSAQIPLPSTARLVKKVIIEYQNIDGSIERKTIPLEDEIDWHYPLIITQSPKAKVVSGKEAVVETTQELKPEKEQQAESKEPQSLAKEPKSIEKKESKKSSKKEPKKPIKNQKSTSVKGLASGSFAFSVSQKNINIKTDKEMLRTFALSEPNRVVVDFAKIGDVKNGSVKYLDGVVKEIKVGNNDGFARVVIELDGKYLHEVYKSSNGYIVSLR